MTSLLQPVRPTFAGRDAYRFSADQFRRLRDAAIVTDADEQDVLAGHFRFSVEQYEKLHGLGIFGWEDRFELLDGLIIRRPIINPPHATSCTKTFKRLAGLVPTGWTVRPQVPIGLATSQPQPDISLARGDDEGYSTRHPGPNDLVLVVEVSESSLADDRGDQAQLYAAAGIVEYWIVNLIDRQVEVMTRPTPTGYANTVIYPPGENVPLTLDGTAVGPVAVNDLLP